MSYKKDAEIAAAAKRAAKQAKNPTVRRKKLTASFLLFSKQRSNGSETKRNPITAADSTKRLSMAIGIKRVSFCPAKDVIP
ncbi:hypothetical protein KW799_02830, partial [Candidatus Parcubacteria bacterium]|nr:hypothetical protein [Candidatus Parcubacteria bacterium]